MPSNPATAEETASRADRASRIAAVGYDYDSRDKEHIRECNLCGSTVHVEVSRRDRYGFAIPVRMCSRCGLCFASPRLTAGEYADLYRGTYRELVSAFHGRIVDATSVQAEQRDYAREVLRFLQESLPEPPASIMDVGGSTGVVGGAIGQAYGAPVTVLDPAPDELAVAEAAGMEAIAGTAEDYDPGNRSWDLVLLCQTIEHLLDARGTLAAIRGMTGAGGHAYIDIAELAYLLRRYGAFEEAIKIDHPFYLTAEVARAYFAVTGLEVVAEHVFDSDGWGFLVRAGKPTEPDWPALAASRERLLDEIRARRAGAR